METIYCADLEEARDQRKSLTSRGNVEGKDFVLKQIDEAHDDEIRELLDSASDDRVAYLRRRKLLMVLSPAVQLVSAEVDALTRATGKSELDALAYVARMAGTPEERETAVRILHMAARIEGGEDSDAAFAVAFADLFPAIC